jgi:hypothetical protein
MNTINEEVQRHQSRRNFLAQAHRSIIEAQKEKKMRAIVLNGNREVVVKTVDAPQMESQTDVLIRLTSTAICGTDLHIYQGRMGNFSGR